MVQADWLRLAAAHQQGEVAGPGAEGAGNGSAERGQCYHTGVASCYHLMPHPGSELQQDEELL